MKNNISSNECQTFASKQRTIAVRLSKWLKAFSCRSGRAILPLLLGAIASLGVLWLSHQLWVQEQFQVKQLIQQETAAIETTLTNELKTRILALKRMAKRWQVNGGTSELSWKKDAAAYLEDYAGYQSIKWVDASLQVRWVMSVAADEAAKNTELSEQNACQTALQRARSLIQPLQTPPLSLIQCCQNCQASVPLYAGDRFDGFLVGVWQINSLLEKILNVPPGYSVRIYNGADLLYSRGDSPRSTLRKTVAIAPYELNWRLEVSATSALLNNARSPLPAVILIGGLVSVWLFVLVLYLAQLGYCRLHQFQQITRQLQQEINQREQIEKALENSQSRLAGILEIASDAIISVDGDRRITLFNQGAERIFGYTAKEVLGQPLSLLMPQRFALAHERHVSHYAKAGNAARQMGERGAIFGQRKDGTEFPAEASISKLDLNGEVIFTTFLRDITPRLQAEQALRQSEARFQAFMNYSPMAAWISDRDGIMVYANQTYFNTFQLPTRELIGKSIFEIYPSEIARRYLESIQTAIRTQQVLEAVEPAIRADGTSGNFLVYKFPVFEGGDRQLVGGIAIDITERQQAETELRQMSEVLENAVSGISRLDARGRYLYVNKAYASIAGYQPEEMIGMDWQKTLHPDDLPKLIAAYHQMLQEGKVEVEATGIRKDGSIFYKHLVMIAIYGEEKQAIGHHCFMKDISDRKRIDLQLRQAMEAAEAANIAKSIFLANMSHELRTPLNVILGFAQVMARDPSLSPSQQEDLQTIRSSGDHLLGLINDVLDLSKIEAGRCILEETSFDLIGFLQALRMMLTERASSKGIQFHLSIAADVPQFITADEQKLRQILLNLLSNAIKFTNRGSITLKVTLEDIIEAVESETSQASSSELSRKVLIFEVADTGVGIAAEELDTIFDAFVQAQAGKISVNGTGLGLTISRKLIELMGGKISVRSTVGEGSIFTFTMPVRPISGVNIESQQPEPLVIGLAPNQPQHRILVVDDRRENRLLLVKLLMQLGLDVREATNGQEALQLWQEWQPDLIWMDIRMPVLDGYEATRQIRATEKGQSSIIIALTAQASQSDRDLALAAGCNDYITKPFHEETLLLKMAEYLGLEYIYAETQVMPDERSDSFCKPYSENLLNLSDLTSLATLSEEWLSELELTASCGDNDGIDEMVAKLPDSLVDLAIYMTNLADNFQFEKIIEFARNQKNK